MVFGTCAGVRDGQYDIRGVRQHRAAWQRDPIQEPEVKPVAGGRVHLSGTWIRKVGMRSSQGWPGSVNRVDTVSHNLPTVYTACQSSHKLYGHRNMPHLQLLVSARLQQQHQPRQRLRSGRSFRLRLPIVSVYA